jgi:catechol 2,3-dioxygenase-like lactoylglutathione lyase family enzyme
VHVSHLILRVTDMERSTAFYRDAVGLSVLVASPQFSFFDAGSIRLALNVGEPPDPSTTTEIVLEVDDIGRAYEEMAANGVLFEVAPRPVTSEEHRELHAAHFRDPDGHLWSLTGWI